MSRVPMMLLVVQSLLLAVLVLERFVPEAHAAEPVRCEITNWPDTLTGSGFATMKVRIEETRQPVPVVVKDWATSDRVGVSVKDWDTYDKVKVIVDN